jgi:hypothetical protein
MPLIRNGSNEAEYWDAMTGLPKEAVEFRAAGLGKDFANKALKLHGMLAQQKQLEADIRDLRPKLAEMIAETGHKAVRCGDMRLTFYQGTNSSISKQRLLELGVPVKTIKKATKVTTYETVQVTEIGK